MGKVKTIQMGDEIAEEKARDKAKVKRVAKKAEKASENKVDGSPEVVKDGPASENSITAVPAEPSPKKSKKISIKNSTEAATPSHGKKYLTSIALVDKNKLYSLTEAVDLVKKTSFSKFDGSAELHLNVTEKGLRGTVSLPHGTGKQVRVRIADEALVTELEKSGKIDFDILVAAPDMMSKLAKVAKVLGPKGLMPNPKTGTISPNPDKLKEELSRGQLQWRTEAQTPIIHLVFGKVSFDTKKLGENLAVILKAIGRDKITSAFIKATMGPSVKIAI